MKEIFDALKAEKNQLVKISHQVDLQIEDINREITKNQKECDHNYYMTYSFMVCRICGNVK